MEPPAAIPAWVLLLAAASVTDLLAAASVTDLLAAVPAWVLLLAAASETDLLAAALETDLRVDKEWVQLAVRNRLVAIISEDAQEWDREAMPIQPSAARAQNQQPINQARRCCTL
jgi:hypothetical protein